MGLDPGYRMGCKVAVVDATGKVLDTAVVYPTHSEKMKKEAIEKLTVLIKKHHVEHIAIGNGTASRETENMTAEMLKNCPGVSYMVVSEAGASVYSASKLAAEEFPQYDVNLRSAISIARRLEDPLAELVKIEPKAIGVGQYQHDMPQKRLEEALDGVVEDCVTAVGVDTEEVREAVERDPKIEAVFLTSPSYDGFSSDLAGIAAYLHSRNIPLIVDAAHGAHLGFSEYLPKSALQEGADVVVMSVHKTLPAPTQTALLHLTGGRIPCDACGR